MEQWDERQLIEYIKECMVNEGGAETCEKIIKDIERLQRKRVSVTRTMAVISR